MNNIELVIDAKAILAEGFVWHPVEEKIHWVDIKNCELHSYDPEDGNDVSLDVNQRSGTVGPVNDSGLLAGSDGFIFDRKFHPI